MSKTLEPVRTYWAYKGSAVNSPTYVFNSYDEAVHHAVNNGEMEGKFKDEWIDWENRNIQEYREDELDDLDNMEFIPRRVS